MKIIIEINDKEHELYNKITEMDLFTMLKEIVEASVGKEITRQLRFKRNEVLQCARAEPSKKEVE